MKKFIVGVSDRGKPTIKINSRYDLTFHVWKDLARLAGHSYNDFSFDKPRSECGEIFEFLLPENLEKGKQVLIGAMFEEDGMTKEAARCQLIMRAIQWRIADECEPIPSKGVMANKLAALSLAIDDFIRSEPGLHQKLIEEYQKNNWPLDK